MQRPTPRAAVSRPAAAPPCISGRTSYLRVRLAFHPYPQVLPRFCNSGGCAPRRGLTPASRCPWIAHPVSGRIAATRPAARAAARPVQARFRSGSAALARLNPAAPAPGCDADDGAGRGDALVGSFYKRHAVTPARARAPLAGRPGRAPAGLRLLAGAGFQGLFHPPPGVLFTFPSRYSSPIGRQRYSALEGGPPGFPRGCSAPAVLRIPGSPAPRPRRAYGALTPSGVPSQALRLARPGRLPGSYNPGPPPCSGRAPVWASSPASLAATTGISLDFCSSGY
jgi:hypothetical protein